MKMTELELRLLDLWKALVKKRDLSKRHIEKVRADISRLSTNERLNLDFHKRRLVDTNKLVKMIDNYGYI